MQKSTFRVRIFKAPRPLIAFLSRHSLHLTTRQRASHLMNRDWTAVCAKVCKARCRFLAARPALVKTGGVA